VVLPSLRLLGSGPVITATPSFQGLTRAVYLPQVANSIYPSFLHNLFLTQDTVLPRAFINWTKNLVHLRLRTWSGRVYFIYEGRLPASRRATPCISLTLMRPRGSAHCEGAVRPDSGTLIRPQSLFQPNGLLLDRSSPVFQVGPACSPPLIFVVVKASREGFPRKGTQKFACRNWEGGGSVATTFIWAINYVFNTSVWVFGVVLILSTVVESMDDAVVL